MNIPAKEVVYKKRIGNLKGSPVYSVGTIGGLHLVISSDGGRFEPIGVSPHPAMSRFIAKKKNPEIEYDCLEKSDQDCGYFTDLLLEYEELTDQVREAYNG